jgi:S-adenosylmethionine/arginine decarboxylase-like enzyme
MQKILPAQHLLVDFFGVAKDKLLDLNFFLELLKETSNLEQNILSEPLLHRLPSGIHSGMILFNTGHLCFRSYPDAKHLAIDVLLESQTDIEKIFALWAKNFSPEMIRKTTITRGLYDI